MPPFQNLVILDLTHVLAGPYATYQFALLGADVIKIENPASPDCARTRGPSRKLADEGLGLNFQVQAANKRALALDLKKEEGRQTLLRLADRADVLVENYSPGALDALDLGARTLIERNPRLIYCSIIGFGNTGDQASRNAYDNVIQAACGVMAATGTPDMPVKTAASMIDYFTGMSAAFAISAALHHRALSGLGLHVQCAMYDAGLAMMAPEVAAHLFPGRRRDTPPEAGLGAYDTAEGKLMLGAFTPEQYRLLGRVLDIPAFASLQGWEDVWAQSDATRGVLATIFLRESAAEWEARLNAAGIPAQRIRTLGEALSDPALARPHYLKTLDPAPDGEDVTVPLAPYRLDTGSPALRSPPPRLGEHTDAVLRDNGFSDAEIAALRAAGAIA